MKGDLAMAIQRTFENGCMSKAQVCEYLGISLATLDREIKKKSIKSLTIGSRRLFTPAMVTDYLNSKMGA